MVKRSCGPCFFEDSETLLPILKIVLVAIVLLVRHTLHFRYNSYAFILENVRNL